MDLASIKKAIKAVREGTKERKFSQSFDLVVTLKGLNLKNPDEQVELFVPLQNTIGKKRKVCAIVGPEMIEKAKEVCDKVITLTEFDQYKDKKVVKKLAAEYDFFIAQADVMPKIAGTFGRSLGPRGKMPNPKAGCILPPKAPVQPVYERLQKTVRVSAKKQPAVQVMIGTSDMSDDKVAQNILTVYDQLIHHLPTEHNNIKAVYLKFTMGAPVKVE